MSIWELYSILFYSSVCARAWAAVGFTNVLRQWRVVTSMGSKCGCTNDGMTAGAWTETLVSSVSRFVLFNYLVFGRSRQRYHGYVVEIGANGLTL
jgi:hypothetical protein